MSFCNKNTLVAIISYGTYSADRICLMLNRLHVPYKVLEPTDVPKFKPTHIILSGGDYHVYDKDAPTLPEWVINSDIPVLAICYGMQLVAHTFGGIVIRMPEKEEGGVEVTEIIDNIHCNNYRWMNRYDLVTSVPECFTIIGVTNKNHIAAFTDGHKWFAIQYHPEAKKYEDSSVFKRFLGLS